MRWFDISSLIVTLLGLAMMNQGFKSGIAVGGLGMLLALFAVMRWPAERRRELLRAMRVPLWLGVATLVGLVMMALFPNVPHPWRGYIASSVLVVAFAYFAGLTFTFVQAARAALRRT